MTTAALEPRLSSLIALEPGLRSLLALVSEEARFAQCEPDYCANGCWYQHIKPKLVRLVGHLASRPELRSSAAYDIAYQGLYRLIPDCRHRIGPCALRSPRLLTSTVRETGMAHLDIRRGRRYGSLTLDLWPSGYDLNDNGRQRAFDIIGHEVRRTLALAPRARVFSAGGHSCLDVSGLTVEQLEPLAFSLALLLRDPRATTLRGTRADT